MQKIAIFASGSGTNMEAILKSAGNGGALEGLVEASAVICNVPGAQCIERAGRFDVPVHVLPHRDFSSRESHEKEILRLLRDYNPDLIVLAGYMRILSPSFLHGVYRHERKLPGVMNIHPALLPSFPGAHGYEDAFRYGVKISGVTVHYVDDGTDTGPIILQEALPICDNDTLETLKARGLSVEHRIYPEAIKLDALGKLRVEGRKVIIER